MCCVCLCQRLWGNKRSVNMVVCGYWDYDCLSPAFGLISSLFTYTHTHTHTHTDTPYYPHWRGLCSCHSLCLECPSLISNYLNSSDRQNPLPRSPLKTWMEWRRQELCSDSFCLNPGPCPHWLCNLEQVQSPFSSVTLDYTNSCLKVLP